MPLTAPPGLVLPLSASPLALLTPISSARQPTARRPRSKLQSKLVIISRRLNRQRIRRSTVALTIALVAVATVVATVAAYIV